MVFLDSNKSLLQWYPKIIGAILKLEIFFKTVGFDTLSNPQIMEQHPRFPLTAEILPGLSKVFLWP